MDLLIHLMELAVALALVLAAFVHLFNPRHAMSLVRQLVLIIGAFWLVPFIGFVVLRKSDPEHVVIGIALLSIGAYAERTPMLPHGEHE
jgi:hypothetical protein